MFAVEILFQRGGRCAGSVRKENKMNVCKDEIRDAIEHELVSANEIHPLFASLHEAYAVILEELEEAA